MSAMPPKTVVGAPLALIGRFCSAAKLSPNGRYAAVNDGEVDLPTDAYGPPLLVARFTW